MTHLSQEEKLNRRKMKNREAAQNARDRKKDQSKKMEQKVRSLIAENRRLRLENSQLRARLSNGECQQVIPQPQTYIPSEYEVTDSHLLSARALSESSSCPSTVESAELQKKGSLPWILDMTNFLPNRLQYSANVLKSTQQTRPLNRHNNR